MRKIVYKKETDEHGNTKKLFVIYFGILNQKTIKNNCPIPNVSVVVSDLEKGRYLTMLGLKSEFCPVAFAERDGEKSAFSVGNGKYEFYRLPFGLKNTPGIFQRAVDGVLREKFAMFTTMI